MGMNWKDVGKIVGKAAPILGTALGGPAGAAIGTMVAGALGVDDHPDAVAAAVAADPQAALKLKELYLNNEASIREDAFQVMDAELKDVQNARDMQKAALNQDDLFSKRFIYVFASFWSVMACLYVGSITFGTIPPANVRFADTCLGFVLGTIVATIFQFLFGTTIGSGAKTSMQNEITKKLIDKQ